MSPYRPNLEPLEPRLLCAGLSALQQRTAYGTQQLSLDGTGQKIVIPDAGLPPNLVQDVAAYDAAMGLPACHLQITSTGPQFAGLAAGWALEGTLDVEEAHTQAPGATIVYCACQSDTLLSLGAGVQWAARQPNVAAVSISWGTSFGLPALDAFYLAGAANRSVICASSGDVGGVSTWPAMSPATVSVGGTTLSLNGNAYAGETAWSGSGGGRSPAYPGVRDPLLAYDADPATGVAVYCTDYAPVPGPWITVGGTSVGAPAIAALFALVGQARAHAGLHELTTPQARAAIASQGESIYYDVTSGAAGGNAAGPGYDWATGYGSPRVPLWVPAMSHWTKAAPPISSFGRPAGAALHETARPPLEVRP